MAISAYLARRLSLSSSGRRSAPAVKVAVSAVAISIAVMIASVAIVLGFKQEIRNKIVGFNSHITLFATPTSPDDSGLVSLDKQLCTILDENPQIESYNLETSVPAVLKTPDDFKGVYIRGLGKGVDTKFLASVLVDGRLPDFEHHTEEPEVLISQIQADKLGLKIGDPVETYFISDDIRVRKLRITGIYNSHFENYDDLLMFGQIKPLQEVTGIKADQGSSVRITVSDFDALDMMTQGLSYQLMEAMASGEINSFYQVENARSQGASYFAWLNMLDTNVIVILVLMTVVACITLISGMLIIIVDKMRFIGIVRSLGLRAGSLRRIFILLALRVTAVGLLIGNVLIIGLLLLQDKTHFIPLNPDSYYFDYVPIALNWGAFIAVNVAAVVIIFLMLLLPSGFAARISPARTMRYE